MLAVGLSRRLWKYAVIPFHRHLGRMPAFPFYGGPPCNPYILARATPAELIADLDRDGIERALVLPNYGVPAAPVSFGFNPLVLEAAAADDRIRCGLWVSPRPQDAELTSAALALAGGPPPPAVPGGRRSAARPAPDRRG